MILRLFFSGLCFLLLISSSYAAGPEVVKIIPGSFGVTALALDEANNKIFALNTKSSTIFVIDGEKNALRSRFKISRVKGNLNMGSNGMAYDPESGRLFIPGGRSSIYIVDTKLRKVVKEIVNKKKGWDGWMSAVHFHPGKREIISLDVAGFILRFDTDGNLLKEYETEVKDMQHFTLSPDRNFMYVNTSNGITRVNLRESKVEETYYLKAVTGIPFVDKKTDKIYVGGKRIVHRLEKRKADDGTRKAVDMKELDFMPLSGAGMALNPNTRHLFIPIDGDRIAVLDADRNKVVKELKVGRGPRSIVVNEKTNMVYVASLYDGSVTVISDQP